MVRFRSVVILLTVTTYALAGASLFFFGRALALHDRLDMDRDQEQYKDCEISDQPSPEDVGVVDSFQRNVWEVRYVGFLYSHANSEVSGVFHGDRPKHEAHAHHIGRTQKRQNRFEQLVEQVGIFVGASDYSSGNGYAETNDDSHVHEGSFSVDEAGVRTADSKRGLNPHPYFV
jgi:hypothetical protein